MASLFDEAMWEDGQDEILAQATEDVEPQMQLGGNPWSSQPGRLRFVAQPLFERESRRFLVHERVVRLRPVQEGDLIPQECLADALVRGLREAVEGVLDRHQVPDADRFYVSLSSNRLRSASNAFFVTGREWRERGLRAEALLDNLQKMLNSNENFELDDSFQLNVVHVRPPPCGSGPRRRPAKKKKDERHRPGHLSNVRLQQGKKSIIKIRRNAPGWCAARVIVTAWALHLAGRDKNLRQQWTDWKRNLHRRQEAAERLMTEVGLGPGPWGPRELEQMVQASSLSEYKLVVLYATRSYLPMVYGRGPRLIGILYDDHHYDALNSLKGFLVKKIICPICLKGYDKQGRHRCQGNRGVHCTRCSQTTCEEYRQAYKLYQSPTVECPDCHRSSFGPDCLAKHKAYTIGGQAARGTNSVCATRQNCGTCRLYMDDPKELRRHRCGYVDCKSCKDYVEAATHRCFVQRSTPEEPNDDHVPPVHVYFDIEAKQGRTHHIPNLLVCQRSDDNVFHRWLGEDCVRLFLLKLEE